MEVNQVLTAYLNTHAYIFKDAPLVEVEAPDLQRSRLVFWTMTLGMQPFLKRTPSNCTLNTMVSKDTFCDHIKF